MTHYSILMAAEALIEAIAAGALLAAGAGLLHAIVVTFVRRNLVVLDLRSEDARQHILVLFRTLPSSARIEIVDDLRRSL